MGLLAGSVGLIVTFNISSVERNATFCTLNKIPLEMEVAPRYILLTLLTLLTLDMVYTIDTVWLIWVMWLRRLIMLTGLTGLMRLMWLKWHCV